MTTSRDRRIARFAIPVLTAGIFFFDCLTSREIVAWGFYFVPLLLSFYAGTCFSPINLAAVFSVLTVTGFYLSPPGLESGTAPLNLTMGLGTLWVAATVVARLRRSERFLQSTLDALSAHISILNEEGMIVAVNSAWNRFARQNNFPTDDFGMGANYLTLCEMAVGDGAAEASAVANGIRSVMAGQCHEFVLEYACHSPQEERWFIARATRFDGEGPIRIVVAHENITKRRQAEELLKQSEEHFRSLFDFAPVAKCIVALDGRLLRVNEAFCRLIGRTAMELAAMNFSEITHSDDLDQNSECMRGLLAGDAKGREMDSRYLAKNGNILWGHVVLRLLRDAKGLPLHFLVYIIDITERRRIEEALQAGERRLNLALRAGGLGAFEHTLEDDRISVSPEFCQIVNLPNQASTCNDDWVRQIHPDDRNCVLSRVQQMKNEQTLLDVEYRLCLPNGSVRWIRAMAAPEATHGKVTQINGVIQNITERKQAELELRKLSRAVEQSLVSIVITDIQGKIEYVNPKFCAVTGYSFENVRGKNSRILKSGEMPPEAYRQMWAKIAAGQDWSGEFHNRKKNGELYWETASISPIRDDLGNITHFVAVKEDITERKRASVLLLESQQNLALATESAHIGIWDWDLVANRKIWDARMYALYGIREQDVSNPIDVWQKSLPPTDWNRVEAEIANALGGIKDFNTEFRVIWPNGEVRHIEAHGLVRRADDGSATRMIGVNWDITERKHAEEALKEQLALRERLAKIAANVPGMIYSFRLRPDGTTSLPYASPTIEELFGGRAEDLVVDASSLLNQIHPEDRPYVDKSIAESARTMLPWRAEFRVRHPKKGLFWVEGRSTPEREADGSILWHGFMSDVTERKHSERKLRESEEKLSKMFKSSPVAISLSTVREGRLLDVNEEYLRMVERTRDEVLGHTSHEIGIWMDPAQRTGILNQLNQRTSLRNVELDLRAKSGRVNHVLWSGEIVVIHGERCLLGSALDITAHKQAQAERENLERQLAEHKANEESARLALEHEQKSSEIKSRFVSMVSHEFRTPLSIINMAAELLDGYLDKMTGVERAEHLTNIRSSVERMTQMMNDFLVHGSCASGKMECQPALVQVEALCRQLIVEVPGCSGSARTIDCAVDPAVGDVWLDEKILRHILGNLLSNAVKYSCDGQPVKLEVKRVAGCPQPNGGTDPWQELHLEFKVSDSGIGIPAADLAKLCQTFHRAANVGNRPGTGMGLAIVKQFVDLHRGAIRFESQEGKGTTVWVQLPIASPASLAKN